jgi:S-adenosylmethionine hydrolase
VTRRAAPGRAPPGRWRPSGIVTLLSDFGLDDPYAGAMRGAVLAVNPAARLVDLTHGVPPQDVLRGALALARAHPAFPPGTVHVAVVDPSVGTARRPLVVAARGQLFVGPDNGLLSFLFAEPGTRVFAATDPRYHRRPVSRTFHGRDLFAPVAGHASLGVPPHRFGPPVAEPVSRPWPRPRPGPGRVDGEVLVADRFGNLLTNLEGDGLAAAALEVGGTRIEALVGAYGEVASGALGAVVDSSGLVEVFVRDGSASQRLGAGPGTPVSLWTGSPGPARSTAGSGPPARPGLTRRPRSRRWRPSAPPPSPSSGTRTGSRSRTTRPPSG